MDKKNMINKRELVNEVLKLMLQFENKNITGTEKKEAVLKVLKNHYQLTEEQIDLIDNFIDVSDDEYVEVFTQNDKIIYLTQKKE